MDPSVACAAACRPARYRLAAETLCERARAGVYMYVIICAGWSLAVLHRIAWPVYGMLVLAVIRWIFLRRDLLQPGALQRWRSWFAALALVSCLVSECFFVYEILTRGLDPAALLLVITSNVISVGAAHGLAADLTIQRVFLIVTRVPLVVGLALLGGVVGPAGFGLCAALLAYVLLLGTQLNRDLWQRHAASERLEAAHSQLRSEVSARERVELELRLGQKLEAIGRLSAGLAHEMNSPLQAALSSVAFVRETLPEVLACVQRGALAGAPDAGLEYAIANLPDAVDLAHEGLQRAAAIVHSVKELSHPGGREMVDADLVAVMRTTLSLTKHETSKWAEVQLIADELPLVRCHAAELGQVFLNLVMNASQAIAARTDQRRGTIAVTMSQRREQLEIVIADNGPGIPDHVRDHLFEPFVTTKRAGAGTGQGLAIARAIVVQRHGGELAFESVTGVGTTFTIRLPDRIARELAA